MGMNPVIPTSETFYVSRMYLENHITQVKDEKTKNETKGSMQTNESAKCLRLLGSNYH
jgi:hypothetical protein